MSDDLYGDLGVPPDADADQIKRAHRAAVRRSHPDNGETGDREEFEKVQRAYLVLSDPAKRAKYDRGEDPDDAERNAVMAVSTIICSAFEQAMREADIVHDDLIAMARELIAVKTKQVRAGIDQFKVTIDKLETVIGRLSAKGERNFIGRMLEGHLSDARRGLATAEQDLSFHIDAHKACDEFEYHFDATDPYWADEDIWNPNIWGGNVRPVRLKLSDLMSGAAGNVRIDTQGKGPGSA